MNRFKITLLSLLAFGALFSCKAPIKTVQVEHPDLGYLYVGTYTDQGSEGIYRYKFDRETGDLSDVLLVAKLDNPSYLTISGDILFATTEQSSGSKAISYQINEDGQLTLIDSASITGVHPCYIEFSPKYGLLMTANYSSGSVSMFKASIEGVIESKEILFQHDGTGPQADRQEAPHAHSVIVDPDGNTAYSADLGADKIYLYDLDDTKKSLPLIKVQSGNGPRHMAFHPNQSVMAVVNELSNTITLFEPDENGYYITETQTISMLPDDFKGFTKAADIHFSVDGKYLYATNRGHNSIVSYRFNESSKKLELLDWTSTEGKEPRNFVIAEDLLIVANQDSNNIVVFRIEDDGHLTKVSSVGGISKPVCLKIY